jgi:hypothetical protein
MKVWAGYGSEHSENLVMIGRFADANDARQAKDLLDRLTTLANDEQTAGRLEAGKAPRRFSDQVREILWAANLHSLGPTELEQFLYDVTVKLEGKDVVIRTEEIEVSAFLKVLVDGKAKVEVYSAHFHPDEGKGR